MNRPLSLGRMLLYSSASAGLNIMAITVGTWILYFYAPPPDSGRTQYLPIALVGVLMTLTSLWDAIIDPFIGHWSDTRRGRWGRRRPFLMFAAPFAVLGLILIWTPPQGVGTFFTATYVFAVIMLYNTAYSLVGIPYDATMPEMAPDSKSLVTLSMWKNIFGLAGVLIGSIAAAVLFDSIGPLAMGIVVAVVGFGTIWLALAGIRETDRPVGEPIGVIEGFRETLKNRQFLIMFFSTLIIHAAYGMITANLPYFVTLVIGGSEGDVSIFLGIVVLLMMISAPVWNWLSRQYPHRKLLMIAMLGLSLACGLNFTVGMLPGVPAMIHAYVTMALIGPTLGGYFVLIYAMMGSVVDYDEMFTQRRREAIYYGTFSLAAGIGPSFAALILPQILETFGYTTANPLGVRLAWLVMGVLGVIGSLVFVGYRLGDSPEETRRIMGLETSPVTDMPLVVGSAQD